MPTPTNPLTVLLTGGGTAGHLTPLLSLVHELKRQSPETKLIFVGHSRERFDEIVGEGLFAKTYQVRAGKLRRYPLTPLTIVQNLRDMLWVIVGLIQSLLIITRIKPDVVFSKGGFVAVPVGLAARIRGVAIVTHDSDSLPGLANRLIGQGAKVHATGMPTELYKYPPDSTKYVGVPIDEHYFNKLSPAKINRFRREFGLSQTDKVLLVIGGSLGASSLNRNLPLIASSLFRSIPGATIIHVAGKKYQDNVQADYDRLLDNKLSSRVRVVGFTTDLYKYMVAANVVLSRAGATTLAELAALGKPSIIVPSPYLAGGHQLSNAQWFERREAVWSLPDNAAPELWQKAIVELVGSQPEQDNLSRNILKFAKPNASADLAKIILDVAQGARK